MSALTTEQALVIAALLNTPVWQIGGKWYREATREERSHLEKGDKCIVAVDETQLRKFWTNATGPTHVYHNSRVYRFDSGDGSVNVNYNKNQDVWASIDDEDYERIVVEI